MKKTRFIFIGCLLAVAAISLFALMKVSPQRESHDDSAMQTSSPHRPTNNGINAAGNPGRYSSGTSAAKSNVRVSDNPDGYSSDTHKTNSGGTGKSVSKPVASTSKINSVPSENLAMPGAGPNLQAGPNGRSTSADKTTDETELDQVDGLYAGNPEACGQDGKPLPSPEAVLARKAQDILKYYKDRKAKDVVVESEIEIGEDGSETELRTNSSQENASPDSADTQQVPAKAAGDTENSIESLAEQNLHDESVNHELQVKQILAALAEGNPPEVRLQAIYLLADVEPDLVKKFLDDKDDLIRNEAERIVGILPQDYK